MWARVLAAVQQEDALHTLLVDSTTVRAHQHASGARKKTGRKPSQALTLRQPAHGLIIHADRGSQYTSSACRARIEKAQVLAGYSRPGNPYDNAQAKASWSTFKTEMLPHGGAFASLEGARLEVAHYLDTYFNLDRRHSALDYRSSHQFERDFLTTIS